MSVRDENFKKELIVLESIHVAFDYLIIERDHFVLQDHIRFPEVDKHEQNFVASYFLVASGKHVLS